MKRLLLLTALALTGISLMAQPTTGKVFIGGDLLFAKGTEKEKVGNTTSVTQEVTQVQILPMAGYFISDKFAIGAQLGLSANVMKAPDGYATKRTYTGIVFSPFARYYLISGTAGLFAEGYLGLENGNYKYVTTLGDYKTKYNLFETGVAVGAYYYISPKLALECKFGRLGYSSETETDENDDKDISNVFALKLDPSSLYFGLTFSF